MDARQAKLQEYLREVAKDLILHGALRRQLDHEPLDILRQAPAVALGAMMRDLKVAGISVGEEVLNGLKEGLFGAIGKILSR